MPSFGFAQPPLAHRPSFPVGSNVVTERSRSAVETSPSHPALPPAQFRLCVSSVSPQAQFPVRSSVVTERSRSAVETSPSHPALPPVRFRHRATSVSSQAQVQPKVYMRHIPNILFKLLFPADGIPAIHLRPASDARLYFVSAPLPFAV